MLHSKKTGIWSKSKKSLLVLFGIWFFAIILWFLGYGFGYKYHIAVAVIAIFSPRIVRVHLIRDRKIWLYWSYIEVTLVIIFILVLKYFGIV